MIQRTVEDELILAYVPESEWMTYEDALRLAEQRDDIAAGDLLADIERENQNGTVGT